MQDGRNETLGIFGTTLGRVMDGTKKKLAITYVKKDGESAKTTFNFKQRKAVQRNHAPARRAAPTARTAAPRAPGAASKAELRKQQKEEAAALAAAAGEAPKGPRRAAANTDGTPVKAKKPKKRSSEYESNRSEP